MNRGGLDHVEWPPRPRPLIFYPMTILILFQVHLNWIEKFGCQKPTKNWQFMFYEAVKNDLANSKETSFNNTISTTLFLITVLFEDLFEAINIQA